MELAIELLQVQALWQSNCRIEPAVCKLRVRTFGPVLGNLPLSLDDELITSQANAEVFLVHSRQHSPYDHLVLIPSRFDNRAENTVRISLGNVRIRIGAVSRTAKR